MRLPKVNMYELNTEVQFTLGNTSYRGVITKIMKPGYQYKDSNQNVVRYLIHISDTQYLVLPHSVLSNINNPT